MLALADSVGDTLRKHSDAHGFCYGVMDSIPGVMIRREAKRHVEILEFLLEVVGRTLLLKRRNT